ncbi:MAG: ribonuclease H-like domain-containing protein [Chloroflexota bacterium]
MNDRAELRRRLRRLGGRRPKPSAEPAQTAGNAGLLPGEELITPAGPAFRLEQRYPLDHRHGPRLLADVLRFDSQLAAEVAGQPALQQVSLERLAFLDTETTGLAGGAGTLVFLVGVGTFGDGAFRLRQYFLRTPDEEAGMLQALQQDLEAVAGFVTFNGQAFDLPLLEMRYLLGLRRHWSLTQWPHLDLLHPARRLWRRLAPDCSLGTLERMMLGVVRTEDDVPGALIPSLYLDYLRSGETEGIARIVYHNAVDVLSLVGLAAQVLERHGQTEVWRLTPPEALAVARWHQRSGRAEPAEAGYRTAFVAGSEAEIQVEALRRLTAHLRQQGRREEAVEGWQAWHQLDPTNPEPCIALAKFYEWQRHDWAEARRWAEEALICLTHWSPGWQRDEAWKAIEHRLTRLAGKLEGSPG